MIIIGDVHEHFEAYSVLRSRFEEPTLQLGDMGIGFPGGKDPAFGPYDYFFRGNHDDPKACAEYANYLGEGGSARIDSVDFFYVPGAWSIDFRMRKEGVSWWPDEELSYAELNLLYDAYVENKPRIMVTHDCPSSIVPYLIGRQQEVYKTRTGQALQAMFEAHKPKRWIFGHYHTDWTQGINGTQFQCLNELSWTEVV